MASITNIRLTNALEWIAVYALLLAGFCAFIKSAVMFYGGLAVAALFFLIASSLKKEMTCFLLALLALTVFTVLTYLML